MTRDARVEAGDLPVSADMLKLLLESSQDVLYAVALRPVRMLYATPAFARRMGLPEDFLTTGYDFSGYLSSVHPEDRDRVAQIMRAIVASRLDAELPENPARYRLRTPEGGWRTIEDSYRLLRDPDGAAHTLIGNARDISEHSHAQQTLKERDARFRLLAENSRDLFFSMRFPEGRFEFLSPSVETLFEYTPQDFYDDPGTLLRCIAPAWRGQVQAWLTDIAQGRVAEEYDYQVVDKSGRLRWFNQRQVLVPTPDGQGMLFQGVASDVTALREAQQALMENEARFRSLAENSRDIFFSFRLPEGRYEFVSSKVVDLLGYTPQDFYADPGLFLRCVAPAWRQTMAEWNAEIAQGVVRTKYEFQVLDSRGQLRWLVERLELVPAPDGQSMRLQGVVADITEERDAREALRASEERYRALAEGWLDQAVIRINLRTGRYEYVSPGMSRVFGFSPEEFYKGERGIVGRTVAPEWRETVQGWMAEAREGVLRPEYEYELIDAWGNRRWVHQRCTLLHAADGRPEVVQGVLFDITEKKRLEMELAASERKYRTLHESMRDGFAATDPSGLIVEYNNAFRDMLGYTDEEIRTLTYRDITPSKWHAGQERILNEQAFTRGYTDVYEKEYRRKDGTTFPVSLRSYLGSDGPGEPVRTWAIVRDISEQKQAEAALRLSKERYDLALKGANDGIWDWDLVEDQVYYSDRWKEILGYAPDELKHDAAEWLERIHPEDFDRVLAENTRCIQGEVPVFQVEYRLRHKDGSYCWIFGRGAGLADASGRVVRMAGAHTDITGRKQAEEALFKSERLSRKLLESMHEGVWAVDANRRTTFVNDRLCAMLGYAPAELMNMSPTDVLEWPQRHVAKSRLSDLEAGYSGAADYVLIRKDGSRFPAHVVSSPVMEKQGRFEGLVCGVVDLTQRARMEHELRRNQARFEALFELSRLTPATEHQLAAFTLREAIRLTDSAAGVLFFVSEDGQQLVPKAWETGEFMAEGQVPSFPASGPLPWATVLGTGLPLLINDFSESGHSVPPGHPAVSRFLGVPALDGPRPVTVLGLTDKGEPYTEEDILQTTLLQDGMWREVRTRRDAERIRASLREKEALLHEVHHRVKNNLQVISSLMDMAGRRLTSVEARVSMEELRGKVQAMSLIHAQLHSAENEGGISLERFVRALFHQVNELYSGGLSLSLVVELTTLALGVDQAVPLGLALNEALTNVFKHACPEGRTGKVFIRAGQDAKGQVCILVRDDGPGLPEGLDPGRAQSLGMKLMHGLVRHQLGGKLEVLNCVAPGQSGVEVCICFQQNMAK